MFFKVKMETFGHNAQPQNQTEHYQLKYFMPSVKGMKSLACFAAMGPVVIKSTMNSSVC